MNRPNILFILSDDQCSESIGCLNNSELKTPNLDEIARNGQLFSNCFCASPVCSPARASILTGSMPSRHGVHDWIRSGNLDIKKYGLSFKEKAQHDYIIENKAIDYLKNMPTYTQVLSDNGYTCALCGKWHLGDSANMKCGFTKWYTIGKGGCGYMDPDIVENGKITFPKKYLTDLISDKAVEFIDELADSDKPFYLSLHYTAPHSPWELNNHKEEFIKLYDSCDYEKYYPNLPNHPWASKWSQNINTPENREWAFKGYEASISAMDAGIGKVIKELKSKGLYDNTIIIFTSDNGFNLGHHGIFGKGNGTYPTNVYEESIKVPFLISYKDFDSGKINTKYISHYDLFPTILDMAGIDYKLDSMQPGHSFLNSLLGECDEKDEDLFIYDEYGDTKMIRTTRYKYVYRKNSKLNALYDLELDPKEENNLIDNADYIDIINELHEKLQAWFSKYTDPQMDGSLKEVTGLGQINSYNSKALAFYPHKENKLMNFKNTIRSYLNL